MCDNCLIDIYHIFMKQWYIYMMNMILHILICVKYSLKYQSTQTCDINVSLALCQILRVVHLAKMSL